MKNHIVVIGASAGGLDALQNLITLIPKNFPAPILVVMHMSPHTVSNLATILNRNSALSIVSPHENEELQPGTIYIATPNRHMVLNEEKIRLPHGPTVNHCRPAIDPLFYSAAKYYGACAIGVVLSGLLDDGSAGLLAIKRNGGTTIVQDLDEAQYPDMPRHALENTTPDYCLTVKNIAAVLIKLVKRPIPASGCKTKDSLLECELKITETMKEIPQDDMNKIGQSSVFSCPDCHSVLWEIKDGNMLRYRCRVGHAYALEVLSRSMDESIENALWAALRALEEKDHLNQRVAEKLPASKKSTDNATKKNQQFKKHIQTIRSILNDGDK